MYGSWDSWSLIRQLYSTRLPPSASEAKAAPRGSSGRRFMAYHLSGYGKYTFRVCRLASGIKAGATSKSFLTMYWLRVNHWFCRSCQYTLLVDARNSLTSAEKRLRSTSSVITCERHVSAATSRMCVCVLTYHSSGDGQSSDHVLEHGIVHELHQTIPKSDLVSADREYSSVEHSFMTLILTTVLLIVLLVSIGFLELLAILSHLAVSWAIDPEAFLGVVVPNCLWAYVLPRRAAELTWTKGVESMHSTNG